MHVTVAIVVLWLCPHYLSLIFTKTSSKKVNFIEALCQSAREHGIVLCVVCFEAQRFYNHRSHMASSGGSHFVAFPCICWSSWVLPASVLWKMRWPQTTRVRKGCLFPGRQQLESSGGLNVAKGPGEVMQLFGGKSKDDLSLCGHSHSVSTAVPFLR